MDKYVAYVAAISTCICAWILGLSFTGKQWRNGKVWGHSQSRGLVPLIFLQIKFTGKARNHPSLHAILKEY